MNLATPKLLSFAVPHHVPDTSKPIEGLAGTEADGDDERKHGGGHGDDDNHYLVLDGHIGAASAKYLPYHGAGERHKPHHRHVGNGRAESLDNGLPKEGLERVAPAGSVAKEVIVEVLLAQEVGVERAHGNDVYGEHVAQKDAENGDEILRAEHVVEPEDDAKEVHAHQEA